MADELETSHDISGVLAAIDALPDANTGDPIADSFTWEDVDADSPMFDIPTPDEPSTPQAGSQGAKASASFSGMTQGGLAKSRGLFAEADQRVGAYSAYSAEQAGYETDKYRGHVDDLQAGVELEKQKTQEFAEEEARLNQQTTDFYNGAAALEQRLAGEAAAERAGYLAQYKEQLSAVRILAAQSGNPIGQMTKGQAFGLAGAQFAQGFLAAQGIDIDVSGQVDRWVDRSIQEHQLNIQNQRQLAEDQMHLYNLARQNAQDEWEARQRYRGFVIEGLKVAIHLNASRFQSDVAMARANQQIARLQIEADMTERQIADAHHTRVSSYMNSEYERAYKMGMLAREDARMAFERRKQEWDENPKNPKNAGKPGDAPDVMSVFSDPEGLVDDTGKPVMDAKGNRVIVNRWRIKPGLPTAIQTKVFDKADEAQTNYSTYLRATDKLAKSYEAAKRIRESKGGLEGVTGKLSWEALARLDDTGAVELFLQDRKQWVMAKVLNDSGKAATDVERKQQEALAYLDKSFARNANKGEKLYANLREAGREKFEAHMDSSGLERIQDGDPEQYEYRPTASPRTKAVDDATLEGKKAQAGFAGQQMARVTASGAAETERGGDNISGTWADYKGHDVDKLRAAASGKLGVSDAAREYAKTELSAGQPEHSVALEMLATAVIRPNYVSKHAGDYGVRTGKDERASEIRREAYEALDRIARGEGGSQYPADAIEYAQYLKRKLDEEPGLTKAMEDAAADPSVADAYELDLSESPLMKRLQWRPKR